MIKKVSIKPMYLSPLFTLLLIGYFTSQGLAQKFTLGVKGGPLMVWPGFADKEERDAFGRRIKPGFSVGGLIAFPLKNNYSLITEGGYSLRSRTITFNEGEWKTTNTFHMADMSMLLRRSFKFMLWRNIPAEGFVNIGPEINYWFTVDGNIKVGDSEPIQYKIKMVDEFPEDLEWKTMYWKNANDWLFGIALGTGLKTPIRKNHHIVTELRFTSGHTFIGKRNSSARMDGLIWGDGGMQETLKTNLKTLSFSVAYTVDIDIKESRKGKSTVTKKIKKKR